MEKPIHITEKYECNGWPSIARPDVKPPEGWCLSLITSLERIRNHRLSPDGRTIAYIKDGETLSDVYVLPAGGGWPARLSTERGLVAFWDDEVPQWSPDSSMLAFCIEGHVHVVPAAGGLPKKISDFTESAFAPHWMPDAIGLIVGVTRHEADQLLLTDRDGSWPRALTTDAKGDHWDPQPAPDGKTIAFVYRPFDNLNRTDICLIDVASGAPCTLYGKAGVRAWLPRWSPDGTWLAFISQEAGWNDLWLIRPDGNGLHQITSVGADISDVEWSPAGRQIACTVDRNGSFNLALVEVESGDVFDLRTEMGTHSRPQWTPDGGALTFEFESPVQPPDLYRMDLHNHHITQLTFSNPPAMACNRLVMPECVSYRSADGLEIPAFLFRPQHSNQAAILHPHGGPSSLYAAEFDALAQYLVAKGYTFLAPNYRGSTGYGLPFEHANYNDWGRGDLQDCLYGARFLRGLPGIDPERLAIFGGSYGGYMTACALSRDPDYMFACGVAKYGDSNLISSWAQCSRELRLYTEIFLGHPARNRQAYLDGSPIREVENVRKPVLILHGLLDDIVPPEASEEWVGALRRHGKTFEYKTYADEPHGFLRRKNQLDVYARIERFLDWYLLV
ncbi:MAG TPA: S9 family peptidase [Anaerolineales bacterium]|nr:S9 family peptidase [Anaerolineales bacterium]